MADDLSFAGQVKAELAHLQTGQDCCRRMELAGLMRALGRVELQGGGRMAISLATDSSPVARKIIRLIRSTFGVQYKLMVMRRRKLRKNLVYRVYIPHQERLSDMLKACGLADDGGALTEWAEVPELSNDHCRRAYLRGTFLGSGWVSPPERQHHLEMVTTATEAADALGQMLFGYGISVRLAVRKESLILYLKDSDQIVRFLNVVGAHQSLLHYEDVRALKEMKNRVNRQVNAELANVTKAADAAARQVEVLERLRASGGLSRLSQPLRELAQLRLNHPDASLKELGEMCNPPVGKSGVAHRMRHLMSLAEGQE
ncbi:MAG: DNA-binding protein WhiA [Bacillota bacterium]